MPNVMRTVRLFIIVIVLVLNAVFSCSAQSIKTKNSSCDVLIDKVVLFARSKLGCPYEWGATGPSRYDCSGLVYSAYKHVGIELSRTTGIMCEEGDHVNIFNIKI